jgi:hypothetical protein
MPLEPPDATVTVLCFVTPPNVAEMVEVPAATPVTWKFVLADPGDTTAELPTVATEGDDDDNVMVVADETTDDMPKVNTCAFPGANVTADGEMDCNTGVVVPPPPDPGTLT